jgi:hypothetical protein
MKCESELIQNGLNHFMCYKAFLLVMSQLAGKRKARVVIQDRVIFFEASQKENHLILSTSVYSGDGNLPLNVRSCVSSRGVLRFQGNGAHLKLDPPSSSVHLVQEVRMEEGKYIPFRHHLSDFSMVADQWREILQDFAERDSFYNHGTLRFATF